MSKTKNLVIVESPAKAKTISPYLGSDYTVKSSFGHIRDLPKKGFGVDKEHNFAPTYEVSPDKTAVINELKKLAKDKTVWLATDEDREGEAIAWHLSEVLKLNPKTTKRIFFHEITKPAILAAIEHPRTVDMDLVNAQQARRVLDRLVGYELSPVLWKKVQAGLSAGRVQSVAVRLIVEREREIKAFEAESSFKVTAEFRAGKHPLPAELSEKLSDDKHAKKLLEHAKKAKFSIKSVDQKPGTRNPGAPFTTSTLQQEAARQLGFSVRQTMTLAQRLYENGHITYMRTDSTTLSSLALNQAEKYIKKEYGDKYHNGRQYQTKDASAQEAHEAIRPTHFGTTHAGADNSQKKLYNLIWRRALASQMAPAQVSKTEVVITMTPEMDKLFFLAKGEVLQFDGFLKVYGGSRDDVILPAVKVGQDLPLHSMLATETFSRPQARYSEASLVKKMEELGIGRPSTYAPTIGTIQDRGYIEKQDLEGNEREVRSLQLEKGKITESKVTERYGADRAKLIPTYLADMVTDFLVKHFAEVVDYDFTAKVEDEFDDIENGKLVWQDMIKRFYKGFEPLVKKSESVSREETSQARELGKDPKTGKPVIARFGRYGPMLQIGHAENEEEKLRFASLPAGTTLETVTLAQAMEMFKLPRVVGKTAEGQEITASIGRFGPYIKVDKLFVSIKPLDPLTITEKEAIKAYKAKLEKEANKYIADFGKLKVVNGPYGPYVTDGKKNAKIAKEIDPKKLTEAECQKLIDEAPAKKGRSFRRAPKKAS